MQRLCQPFDNWTSLVCDMHHGSLPVEHLECHVVFELAGPESPIRDDVVLQQVYHLALAAGHRTAVASVVG